MSSPFYGAPELEHEDPIMRQLGEMGYAQREDGVWIKPGSRPANRVCRCLCGCAKTKSRQAKICYDCNRKRLQVHNPAHLDHR